MIGLAMSNIRLLALLSVSFVANVTAGTPPSGFSETVVASGISSPTAMAFAPDGRLFVCQQNGALRVIKNGALLATPFLTLSVDPGGERGLLGIAFDPDFAANQYIYLYYTRNVSPRNNRISRFTANGDVVATGSEVILVDLPALSNATNHNGGAMNFGPDGKLYVAVGENANTALSQSITTTLGKMLRYNKDGSIPADNPTSISGITGTLAGANRAIWAAGLRNPFTFAFQPGTGRIFINDVGQNNWEEVNEGASGVNFGWPTTEGDFTQSSFPNFRRPFYTYAHGGAAPTGCAITGGTFYNPSSPTFPSEFVGQFLFADFCSGWIYRINSTGAPTPTQFLTGGSSIVDLKVGPDAALYYLERGNSGRVLRVAPSVAAPQITQQPSAQTVAAGLGATFTVQANGTAPLSYQWQRNGADISGARSASYTLNNAQAGDSGALFRVIVTNSAGNATSNTALLTVVANQPPTATIAAPAAGSLFSGGDTIFFNGSANDPETGAIASSTLRWQVDYITGAARRPFVQPFNGAGGSFTVPTQTPYLLTDVYFEIILTATDPQGFQTTVTRRVDPRVSNYTVTTAPAGLAITLDGVPAVSPQTVSSVVGLERPIGTLTPQGTGGTRNVFVNWSDGGDLVHNIFVPITNATFTATFRTEHLLTTAANPAVGGTVSGAGWYTAGTSATVGAAPAAGWTFTGFTGDASGTTSPQSVVMSGPKAVTANFAPMPAMLAAMISGRANGTGVNERVWTVMVRNMGSGPAVNARIVGATVTAVFGSGAVSVVTPMPVALGTIAAGGSAVGNLVMQFPATTPPARISLRLDLAADFGVASSVTLNNLFR